MPSGGNCPQHQERSVVRRIERGFDFLGYHFRPGQLTVAKKTIEQFVARAIRLYEQEPVGTYNAPLHSAVTNFAQAA